MGEDALGALGRQQVERGRGTVAVVRACGDTDTLRAWAADRGVVRACGKVLNSRLSHLAFYVPKQAIA